MNELAQKWVEALRSGKYSQTRSVLFDGVGYCCLGVLCDVVDHDLWEPVTGADEDGPLAGEWWSWDGEDTVLTQDLRDQVGIPPAYQDRLVHLNDSAKSTFEQIADDIERYFRDPKYRSQCQNPVQW